MDENSLVVSLHKFTGCSIDKCHKALIVAMQYLKQVEVLEQKPCEDAVSRQAALDAMYALCDTGETLKENPWRDNPHIDAITDALDNLQSVTPQPKEGYWIDADGDNAICGCCNRLNHLYGTYCKYCGAKMEESEG